MNKPAVIISTIILLFASQAQAQSSFEIGLRLNPEFTGIINHNDADAGDELNFTKHFSYASFGVGAIYNFNKNMGVGVDILFSREGQSFDGTFNEFNPYETAYSTVIATQVFLNNKLVVGSYEALAELNYIKVPLMLSLTSDNTKHAYFTALVGPQFNILQGVAMEVNGEDLEFPHTDFVPKDLYKPVTLGAVLALGGAYNICPHFSLSTRLRIDYGFNDAEQKDKMVSYYGLPSQLFYPASRAGAHAVSAGFMVGLNFKM